MIAPIVLIYPVLIYAGLNLMQARWIALIVFFLFAIRLLLYRKKAATNEDHKQLLGMNLPAKGTIVFATTSGLILLLAMAIMSDSEKSLLLLPTVINLAFFLIFSTTLLKPPPIAERIARLTTTSITNEQKRYCYTVTALWSLLFLFNTATSLVTALFCDIRIWTLFNGLIVYFLIAALFTAEVTYRYWRFRVYDGSFFDSFFYRIFPPRSEKQKYEQS